MKEIKLILSGEHTLTEEDAKALISTLQAQLDAPEPVEFWEGQLVEVWSAYDNGEPRVQVRTFCRKTENGAYECYMDATRKGATYLWENCRPLCDPLIDQYKPLEYCQQCPLKDGVIKIKSRGGHVSTVQAAWFNLHRLSTFRDVIGWMPADGWGRSE